MFLPEGGHKGRLRITARWLAYVVRPDGTERWPVEVGALLCGCRPVAMCRCPRPVEPPPGLFTTVPAVEAIDATAEPATYRVTLREATGHAETFELTVADGDIPLVTGGRDLSDRWPGDAASLRAVLAAVIETHRRR